MRWVMNEEDMNRMLDEICPEGETYTGKAWGTIVGGAVKVLALGALSNVYCYLGTTEHFLVIAVLGTVNIDHVKKAVRIPFDQIEKISIRHGLFPGQRFVKFKGDGIKMKISLLNNPITTKVKSQKEGMAAICDTLKGLGKK